MKQIKVEAKPDHVQSLSKVSPLNALAELIWNALDADATRIYVDITENGIHGIDMIEVRDNGLGLRHEEVESAFGSLGDSWKRRAGKTSGLGRALHGKEGRGRFRSFGLGPIVQWTTRYRENGGMLEYKVRGNFLSPMDFEVDESPAQSEVVDPGTTVSISGMQGSLPQLSAEGNAADWLSEHFALYLREYPDVQISWRGKPLDPASAEAGSKEYDLPRIDLGDGKIFDARLVVIQWQTPRERKLCLCDAGGFTLTEIKVGVRLPGEHTFTAYLRSDFLRKLKDDNLLDLEELNPDLDRLLVEARERIREHFRDVDATRAQDVVQEWKTEGSYPFRNESTSILDTAQRQVFDICALNLATYLPDVRKAETKTRRFTFRVLRQALENNADSLQLILDEVLDLPADKREEFAELIRRTSLRAIISAAQTVTRRLDFLRGLEAVLYDEHRTETKERSQLHRIMVGETWIFGERFHLAADDESLTTVLSRHLKILRPGESVGSAVKRDDGRVAVIDMMLGQSIPYPNGEEREYLVIELKRPATVIDLGVKAQIESYGMTVSADDRFDKQRTKWTFIAIGGELNEQANKTVNQQGLPKGYFHMQDGVRIGLTTWAEVLHDARVRMEFFRQQLEYSATRDSGVEYLQSAYEKYLPPSLRQPVPPSEPSLP
jgi:hypothetical protein